MSTRSALRTAAALCLALLGGCDAAGLLAPDYRHYLRPGLYTYDSWTEWEQPAWWGYVEIQVDSFDGTVRGSYRLPEQCTDGYGWVVDCVGRVAGRVYADGTLHLGFDEGWLRQRGEVDRYSEVHGSWDTRLLGVYESGRFELLPY